MNVKDLREYCKRRNLTISFNGECIELKNNATEAVAFITTKHLVALIDSNGYQDGMYMVRFKKGRKNTIFIKNGQCYSAPFRDCRIVNNPSDYEEIVFIKEYKF